MKELQISRELFQDVSFLIEQTKKQIASNINAAVNILYWNIGKRVKEELLKNQKPEYGKQVIETLSSQLTESFGKGYSKTNLFNFIRLFEVFTEPEIFHAVSGKLTWTHLRIIIYIEDELKRSFYIEMCKLENWSTRTLQDRIKSMLYERTAISKKPEDTIKNDLELLKTEKKITPIVSPIFWTVKLKK